MVSLSIQIGAGVLTADPDYGSFGIATTARGKEEMNVAELATSVVTNGFADALTDLFSAAAFAQS